MPRLLAIGHEIFAPLFERPAIRAFWEPKLQRIAERFTEQHLIHLKEGAVVEPEVRNERAFTLPDGMFKLTARIDRRETLPDGTRRLIDYKTGTLPKLSDVWRGVACQLLLEALMEQAPVSGLQYWPLKGVSDAETVVTLQEKFADSRSGHPQKKEMDFNQFLKEFERKFSDLIAAYADPETPYRYVPSETDKPKYDDYEHLARVKEWRG